MPRLFMAVRREQRYPITEILAQTPESPEGGQWAIFLRNHDELTLEMVSDEDRDYLFAEYAKDPRMKRHMGIGRRLAPLLDRDRRLTELLNSLLLSLPGSPVLYYGDEIQMGDNLYLGDRDSVRTPMQWTPDRNGGFSRADFAQLYLPPLMDPVYGFAAVNVEAQQRNPSSFLHWMKRMLAVRRQFSVFGTGAFEALPCANPSVLAFVRSAHDGDVGADPGHGITLGGAGPDPSLTGMPGAGGEEINPVLCIHNLSRFSQPAELYLGRWAGRQPVELLGRVPFPVVGTSPYPVTLAPYGFQWFELVEPLQTLTGELLLSADPPLDGTL
jgi:maltose alpha-D-glucosyltransferase/alpha-amylase